MFFVKQFPTPSPVQLLSTHLVLGGETWVEWLSRRMVELVYSSYDMDAIADDLGDTRSPYIWNRERRILLRAEVDAAAAPWPDLRGRARRLAYLLGTFSTAREAELAMESIGLRR